MLRIGHIDYSNCVPVHALLLEEGESGAFEIRRGVPTELNAALAGGDVDVAPSSSIEYARHADRYRILPGPAIASVGPVESILLETRRPIERLDGAHVALPSASATSVVLLRILLETMAGVRPRYSAFGQTKGADPVTEGADAALWIGDAALRRAAAGGSAHELLDLGRLWTDWTGLPFVFALWQVSAGPDRDPELRALSDRITESRAYFRANAQALAERYARVYGLGPDRLLCYWNTLEYSLDDRLQQGLLHFYRLAVDLGEAPRVPELRWVE